MIRVENLSLRQGAFALRQIDFTIASGQYGVLMGRTGSGKTTILEAICGLRSIQSGRIVLGQRDITNCPPSERGLGYVPQDRALFATMTVEAHLAFALRMRRWSNIAIEQRVQSLARLLGIPHLLARRPAGLSGGEAQRVALGRALSMQPEVLLFDEPLSGLDDETREEMYDLIQSIRAQQPVTVLHITHNRQEAERLADHLLLLEGGAVRELALHSSSNDVTHPTAVQSPAPAVSSEGARRA